MAKIPFTLDAWLKDKSQKVETRDGRPSRIICTDRKFGYPIIALAYNKDEDKEVYINADYSGKSQCESKDDLFLVTPEEELTEFESTLKYIVNNLTNNITYRNVMKERFNRGDEDEQIKEYASELLAIALKEIQPKIDAEIEKAYKNHDDVVFREGFEKGKEEALKDMPRWKTCGNGVCGNGDGILIALVKQYGGYKLASCLDITGEKYIMLSDLEKLPGFKED